MVANLAFYYLHSPPQKKKTGNEKTEPFFIIAKNINETSVV